MDPAAAATTTGKLREVVERRFLDLAMTRRPPILVFRVVVRSCSVSSGPSSPMVIGEAYETRATVAATMEAYWWFPATVAKVAATVAA